MTEKVISIGGVVIIEKQLWNIKSFTLLAIRVSFTKAKSSVKTSHIPLPNF